MRTVTDIVRRGFDSTVANWPLILIRIGESLLFLSLLAGAVIAFVVPVAVSLGIAGLTLNADAVPQIVEKLVAGGVMLLLYGVGLATAVLLLLVLVHSFVQAGIAKVFVDAERAAGPAVVSRDRLNLFDVDRWLAGGRAHWWTLFLIYNIAWTVAGAIMLVPLLLILGVMIVFRESTAGLVIGCLALAMMIFVIVVIAILTNIWTQKAIALAVQRRAGALDSLRDAWREARSDFGRHFAVAFIMLVLTIGGTGAISSLSLAFSIPGHAGMSLVFSPMRVFLSLVSSAFSAAVANWFLASFVALSAEEKA